MCEDAVSLLLDKKELIQIQNDIKRCEHFHPLVKSHIGKHKVLAVLCGFLALNPDCSYIQGLDSITVVLYS